MLLLKNPQFLRNQYETWSKCGTHEKLSEFLIDNFCSGTKIGTMFDEFNFICSTKIL